MLDFDDKIYDKLLRLAIKRNIVSNCREYPSLVYGGRPSSINRIGKYLYKKFSDHAFKCGLYVHFPFCISRCSFCKYYSEINTSNEQLDDFLSSLEKELTLYSVDFNARKLENLFLGGGTPTILDEFRTKRLLELIYKHFSFKEGSQKTIEGTPESLTLNKLKLYKDLGINRISVGLQSSNNHVLQAIGRRHTDRDVFKVFELIRTAGIDHIGTELIWGLPGESMESYKKTFNDLIKLSPDFIEGYLLTTGGRVKINRSYPSNVTIHELIDMAKERLLSNGYRLAFEGNFLGFIKKGVSRSDAVNQNTDSLYRHKAFVLGVGPGASSHFPDKKYMLASGYDNYSNSLNKGASPAIRSIKISKEGYKRHYIISQIGFFRRIYKGEYRDIFGNELSKDFSDEVSLLKKNKIINETAEQYIWNLNNFELGHKPFYWHILKYWYSPVYIRWIMKNVF